MEQYDVMINACGQSIDYKKNSKLFSALAESDTINFTFMGTPDVDAKNL